MRNLMTMLLMGFFLVSMSVTVGCSTMANVVGNKEDGTT